MRRLSVCLVIRGQDYGCGMKNQWVSENENSLTHPHAENISLAHLKLARPPAGDFLDVAIGMQGLAEFNSDFAAKILGFCSLSAKSIFLPGNCNSAKFAKRNNPPKYLSL